MALQDSLSPTAMFQPSDFCKGPQHTTALGHDFASLKQLRAAPLHEPEATASVEVMTSRTKHGPVNRSSLLKEAPFDPLPGGQESRRKYLRYANKQARQSSNSHRAATPKPGRDWLQLDCIAARALGSAGGVRPTSTPKIRSSSWHHFSGESDSRRPLRLPEPQQLTSGLHC